MVRALLFGLMLATVVTQSFAADSKNEKAGKEAAKEECDCECGESKTFELRTYHTNEGKLDDLNARFRDHTNRLFKKHGITIVGFWTPQDAEQGKQDTLIYLLSFPSREAATASWKAFREDAEWIKARDASEVNGKLVNKVESVFLDPTDYSPIK